MKLKNRLKNKDEYCTKFVLKQIETVKKYFGISNSKRVYALDWWCDRYYFLCDDKVYAVYFEYENKDAYKPIVSSAYVITLKDGEVSDFKVIKPDDTTPKFNEVHGVKFDITRKILTKEHFGLWYSSPCRVNLFVDVPYSKAIEFLQNYKRDTFKTDRYLFYAKRDKDLTWKYFIYAFDLKTKTELKIYVDDWMDTDLPVKLSELYVKDLSGKLSDYQILQCKKSFFEYCRKNCEELNAPNFYALEFVKQCIQPIEKDRGWWIAKPWCETSDDFEVWIDDILGYDEKPYFLLRNKDRTRIAAIDFYKPEYKSTKPYISGYTKFLHWNIDKETLEKLDKFLHKPFDYRNTTYYKQHGGDFKYDENITNWHKIIKEYNRNTGSSHDDYIELPLDLPIPDYKKLLETK